MKKRKKVDGNTKVLLKLSRTKNFRAFSLFSAKGHLEFLCFLCNDRIPVAWHRREGFLPCSDAGSQHYLLHLLFLLVNATKTRCILILFASVMQYHNLVIFNLEDSLQNSFALFSQDNFE